jgi:ADP-heptose:LPS heptosyltransferase
MSAPVSIPMQALQRADALLGSVACLALQPLRWCRARRRPADDVRRVLAIKFWGVGSLQLLTPAAAALRQRRPGAEIVLLTLAANRECAERLGVFDRVLSLDVAGAGWPALYRRIAALVLELRRERFDEVYDFEFFTRFSAVVSVLTGARRLAGFASTRVWRGGFHDERVPFNRYWHVARNFRVLAGGEDGRNVTAADLSPVRFDGRDERALEELLARRASDPSRPLAVLNPNAGTLSLERRWPPARFGALARRLALEDGLTVVLIGTAGEREHTEGAARAAGLPLSPATSASPGCGELLNLAGELSTGMLAALLARAAVVVTNDSGPMHLAAALGAPTVGLFGPETPVMYAPLGLEARALYRPPPCSPCINVHDNKVSSCIFGEPQCLVNIEVDEVLAAARAARRGMGIELLPHPPVRREQHVREQA